MHKYRHGMMGLIASIAVFAVTAQVHGQVDMAAASGIMADIYVAVTQANANWAADPGNAALKDKAGAAEKAAEDGLAAYRELEAAGDDQAAAEEAFEKLKAAYGSAMAAAGEAAPAAAPPGDQEGETKVNPERILWQSPELQKIYAEFFEIEQNASAQGGAEFVEHDATKI